MRDAQTDVDVVVIGGGVNGTGVARDCALRGLRVALFERNDVAFGASGNSSGMIHGGPRYLTSNPDVTRSSCEDSGRIQQIAPHLLFRVPFLLPVFGRGMEARTQLELFDAFFALYDRFQPLKHGKMHARLTGEEMARLEPGIAGELLGGVSFDEWGIDGARLCIGNLVDAFERGARVFTHTTVDELVRDEAGRVTAVRAHDLLDGGSHYVTTKVVVNATGAWAPLTVARGGLAGERARVRPGKGIHVVLDRRLTNYAVIAYAIDGRMVFLEPWQNVSVIGTTDDDYYGDLDDVVATTDEVRYLVQAVERVFPAVRHARAIGTWAGVRPTLFEWGKSESALSREHQIVDHAEHGAAGLYSMLGGKLASFRQFSEEMTDRVAASLGHGERCQTHRIALPGGDAAPDVVALASAGGISHLAASRLAYRHGSRAAAVVERMSRQPRERHVVCDCEPVTEAEIRHCVENEWARTVDDVSRRTRLGLGSCGGMRCASRCGAIVAQARGQSPGVGHKLAIEFLTRGARARASTIGPQQARQEATLLGAIRSQLGGALGDR